MTKDDLLKFCAAPGCFRESVKNPFSLGEYTYATDGHIAVRVPRLADVAENPEAPDPGKIWPAELPIELVPVPDGLAEYAPVPCPKCSAATVRGAVECPECHGFGEVTLSNAFNEYDVDCKTCDGEGEVPGCPKCDDLGRIEVFKTVQVSGVLLQAKYLALMADLPGCLIGTNDNERKPSWFRFDGGEGVLMPCLDRG